jgi:hypothetical protein
MGFLRQNVDVCTPACTKQQRTTDKQQINNSSTTRHALCSVPEMTEMISETCEAHAVYFYPKTGKKC